MRAEVLAIGTELLLGQIVDTNSSWIGEQLAVNGMDCFYQAKVGDNLNRIVEAVNEALTRCDVLICSGGLGPTQDDLTRNALAAVAGVELIRDDDMADRIMEMFMGRGRSMPQNNLRQAERPEGARFLETQPGTAPGLVMDLDNGKQIYALPGVPWEMQQMMTNDVLPALRERAGVSSVIVSRTLRTWGMSESALAEALDERMTELDQVGNPTIAFLASGIEGIKVRLTASGPDREEVDQLLDAEEELVRQALGDVVFGIDDETMESSVLAELSRLGMTIGVAESLTGGLVGARICDVPGASAQFRGSIVSYASDVKFDLLGVPRGPVISEEAAVAMADGARRVIGSDVGIAATGVAGPDSAEGHRPGTVCIAVVIGDPDRDGIVESAMIRLPGMRQQVRELSVISLLSLLRSQLLKVQPGQITTAAGHDLD